MKEKTFEELIGEYAILIRKDDTNRVLVDGDVLKLMQQVREATIAECMEIAWKEKYGSAIHGQIASLEADRIRIEP